MRAGLLESRPRTRELIYIFGIWRAARMVGDIKNQWNEMTAAETADYWVEITPLLDPDVARKYAHVRPAPGHGLQYTIALYRCSSCLPRACGSLATIRAEGFP